MKSFASLKKQIQESPVFNDPPTILTMRRAAIRMLPGKQSVALYKNDSLGIEVAIPYTPGKLGRHRGTGISECKEDRQFGTVINGMSKGKNVNHIFNEIKEKHGEEAAGHFQKAAHAYASGNRKEAQHHYGNFKSGINITVESLDEAMSPELKKIRKERTMFKRDLSSAEDKFEISKTRLDWAKRALAGHIKKHGKVLKPIGEETNPTIMEATVHALHAISRTQQPAQVRFRDGSTAMIDHPTASRVMWLHKQVNPLNRKKIQSMINSGASGIKKVLAFIDQHVKTKKAAK